MQLNTLAFLVFLGTSQATALPPVQAREEAKIDAFDSACVYFCTETNWAGDCKNVCGSTGLCINLPSELAGKASSLGPSEGISGMQLFSASDCAQTGDYMQSEGASQVQYPGFSDLSTFQNGRFDKNVRSYITY
ncbi:hypothetical protein EJ03DRAFT_382112 [Teratosphaeria nubilosa]|uniref:Uncharacterized protein n=1 Tax=Teratosphaeria nubilosa TaxID=161662 RepID=A0A6G1LC76_9PEZI|nr:hypothetical protein EJ03DRAFT_382112 [Teratosphaeria nubilosa]